MKLSLFGFVPLGRPTIRLVKLDGIRHELLTEKPETLLKGWNHPTTLRADVAGRTLYRGALEAGWPTLAVQRFAGVFYRHRRTRPRRRVPSLERPR